MRRHEATDAGLIYRANIFHPRDRVLGKIRPPCIVQRWFSAPKQVLFSTNLLLAGKRWKIDPPVMQTKEPRVHSTRYELG